MEHRTILELNTGKITAALAQGERLIVQDVSFSIDAGESLALIGETGSGKTMTALLIMGMLPENVRREGGSIRYREGSLPKGRALRRLLGSEIVYIPQNGAESLNPSLTVRKQLYDGLKKNGTPYFERGAKMCELLEKVGFAGPEEILKKYPFELSGGMAQRVTIALAACGSPKLVLADEPTNGLDEAATKEFFSLLDRIFPDSARLVITHDISIARLCTKAVVLCKGKMCEKGPAGEVLDKPRHPYTQALINALVTNGMQESPVIREDESPCPFYRRCPKAVQACRNDPEGRCEDEREWWCRND